ncbi:MAG: hypothetical protein WAL56_09460 [Candidatus Sulfotelmatobacter sp.]
MRVLLIDPLDSADAGPWANQRWDRIIDLGMGGNKTYERWSRHFHCSVTTLDSLRDGFEDFRWVRRLMDLGYGRLMDEYGLDWWEIMSILLHGELETLILLQRLVQTFGSADEVQVTRSGLHGSLLQALLPERVKSFPLRRGARKGGIGHYVRISKKLSAPQIVDIFWDKYDAGYQLRGRVVRKRKPSKRPVVLLPTAYVNVSRTGIAYANTFPGEEFLLVSTRKSGWVEDPPKNVATAWLSSYASLEDRGNENRKMCERWGSLLNDLAATAEFDILQRLGYLDSFPQRFRHGLEVRDAWRNVLDTEPVEAVLCADDSNPYTRIPLLLAQGRGLPNIACHHGALDGRYVFKRSYGEVIWAKGRMEKDYLVRNCGVPQETVEIAAPAPPANWAACEASRPDKFQPYLIFFSEACDVSGAGRQEEFYGDILPPLAELALATGRELIVKLHPAESGRERTKIICRILSPAQKAITRIVSGSLTEDLLAKAWFGITILSTVAFECAIRDIPCFLCKWLEFWPYGYIEQFVRFGVGLALNGPAEIQGIPEYLEHYVSREEVRENCWSPATAGRLREFVTASRKRRAVVAS